MNVAVGTFLLQLERQLRRIAHDSLGVVVSSILGADTTRLKS
jgi:hypothetical protein